MPTITINKNLSVSINSLQQIYFWKKLYHNNPQLSNNKKADGSPPSALILLPTLVELGVERIKVLAVEIVLTDAQRLTEALKMHKLALS